MRYAVLSMTLLALVLVGCHQAQEIPPGPSSALNAEMGVPEPAAELDKFKVMLGNWGGSGTVTMAPGMSAMPWTSKSTYKWILGGHFMQEEIRIDMGKVVPPIFFRTYFGWDSENKRLVTYDVGSTGELLITKDVAWVDDGTLVTMATYKKDGIPTAKRHVVKFTKDESTFKMQAATGAGDFFTIVEGTMYRTKTPFEISDAELKTGMGPAPEQMKKLQAISGQYTMTGKMVMTHGMPEMTISGKDSIEPIFGGSMLYMHFHGDPMPNDPTGYTYEGIGYMSWDAENECYKQIWLNNMGQPMDTEMRWVGDNKLVSMSAGLDFGQPHASRATWELNETGSITNASMERMSSTHKMERAFFGEYTKNVEKAEAIQKKNPAQ